MQSVNHILFHGLKRVWPCTGLSVSFLCVWILVSELQCFQHLTTPGTLLSCFETHLKKNKKTKKTTPTKYERLISAALLAISSRSVCRFARHLLIPPTSIEKINAIHYHYRQEEIQGQREWNASHRFFWHIHHICDERDMKASAPHFSGWNKTG